MNTIQPTGASGVANLPAASSATPQDIPKEGLQWGVHVVEVTTSDPSFNFDAYAQNIASSMTTAGFSADQISRYINGMYAGYALDGGLTTLQTTGPTGSGVSTAGVVGNPDTWGSLDLPGQNGAAGIEAGGVTVGLTPSTAYNLGAQLGSQSSAINYTQWRANVAADLQRAGYSQADVQAFMAAFESGYNAAHQSAGDAVSTNGMPSQPGNDAFGTPMAGTPPPLNVSMFSGYLSHSNATLSNDANALSLDLAGLDRTQADLQYAEWAYEQADHGSTGLAPDSTGTMYDASWWGNVLGGLQAKQKGAWAKVRGDEAKFYGDLAATAGDANASAASVIYKNYVNDPWYTMEGAMPSSFTGMPVSPSQQGAVAAAAPPVSSVALNGLATVAATSDLPAGVSHALTDPFVSRSINAQDFTQIAQGYEKLFQTNPALYWSSLANIKDPNLSGAINYAVQDMAINHPQEMTANGASADAEKGQLVNYFQAMHGTPATYLSWAPPASDMTYTGATGSISAMVKAIGWPRNQGDITNLLQDAHATSDRKHNEHNYSDACQFMASLYKNHRSEYYQVLSQTADPKLRDMINRDVQAQFVNNPSHYGDGGNHAADQDFKKAWSSSLGKAGASAGGGASDAGITLSVSSPTNGV